MSYLMVHIGMIQDLLRGVEIPLGKVKDLTLKGDFTAEQLVGANPVPMLLTCPTCHIRHIDEGLFASKPHHTHACQICGHVWRPAIIPTVGVRWLPGFKDGK